METLASGVVPIIWGLAAIGFLALVYLAWQAVSLPRRLQAVLRDTLTGLNVPIMDSKKGRIGSMLNALSIYVKSADEVKRAELRKFLEARDWRQEDFDRPMIDKCKAVLGVVIQILPLLGILGTVLAIAGASDVSGEVDLARASAVLGQILELFGSAITSTIWGLACAVILMLASAVPEEHLRSALEAAREYRAAITEATLISFAGETDRAKGPSR